MIFRLLALLAPFTLASAALAMGPWIKDCGGDIPCELGERSYHYLPPENWDGTTPLPVLLHFHGWQRDGRVVVNHDRIAGATQERGVLLLAPNGVRRTWNFRTAQTDDVAFAAAVIEDAAARYPIDRSRIYISGYSFGGAMAWRYVCENGAGVAALLAISGSLPQTTTCPQAPREVRHVHGLDDTVMQFPMGPQGDTTYPVALWRERFDCGAGTATGPWQMREFLTFERQVWDCPGGRVTLDLHAGGHFIPHGWIARQLDELLGLPPGPG